MRENNLEQPLPPYGSCLLGSINLTKFVINPLSSTATFNWPEFEATVEIFTRMLDNVVELNGLPLKQQQDEIFYKRRHGMGFMGLGSTLSLLKIPYDSPGALEFTDYVTATLAKINFSTGISLAEEKGCAPIFENIENREKYLQTPFIQKICKDLPGKKEDFKKYGSRFTHFSSIAPTGTISLAFGNNISNGIEPSFSLNYKRNRIVSGKKSKEQIDVYAYEALVWKELYGDAPYPDYFKTADNIAPKAHINIQAAAQKWIDSSISKTINVPTETSFEEFKDLYQYAYDRGLKGCATFRFNPEVFQGVLVKEEDLENTFYTFNLENGETITCKGNEDIFYEGETHKAANLFDALKEGYYGRF